MSFGSFGGSGSSFNPSTNLFGQPSITPNTSLFGQTTNPSPLTGGTSQTTGGSLFGGSSGFGGFGAASTTQVVATGTGQFKFNPLNGQDTVNKNGTSQTINTMHQCITAMKEYESKSFEELRFEDYQANRKYPTATSQFGSSATTNLFGGSSTSGFGSSSSTTGGGLFGSTAKPSLFGTSTTTTQQPQTTTLFGGQQQQNRSFFGGSSTTASTTSPFGGFGSTTTTQPASSGFGTTGTTTSGSLFGGLGQTQQQQQPTTGLFGSTTQSTGGGIFGSQQNKPLFSGFGQSASTTSQPATTGAFNFSSQTQQQTTTTPSLFGSSTTTQSPLSAAKPFGSTTTTGFGGFGTPTTSTTTTGTGFGSTATTGGLFGSPAASSNQPKPFGSLTTGTTTTTGGFGGFGSPSTQTTTTPSLFGGFGSTTQQQQTASPFGSSLGTTTATTASPFGQATSTTPSTGGGLFGTTSTTTQPTLGVGFGGFGQQPSTTATTSGGGLFGSTTQTTQQTLGGLSTGLGGTLGGGLGQTGGFFGSTTQPSQQTSQFSLGGLGSTTSTSLGGIGSTSGAGLFGSTGNTTLGLGGSTLGGLGSTSTLQQQQQQQQQLQQMQQSQLQLSQLQQLPLVQQQLSNSPYGTGSLLKTTIQDLNKKEDIFKPVSPIAQRPYITEATSPAKVTSSMSQSVQGAELKGGGGLSQTIKITPKALTTISLNKPKNDLFEGLEDEEVPCFYPRKNIKKLLFKPQHPQQTLNLNETDTSRRSSTANSLNGENIKDNFMFRKSTTYPDDSYRLFLNNNPAAQITTDSTNISEDGHNVDNRSEISQSANNLHPANITLERPGYFTIPSMQELSTMLNDKGECLVDNFAIGRVDYGCITFPGLTNLTNMNLDEIVHIRRKEVHVYPDDSRKPPVGQGLNKPAEITLHRIWPTDKQTKETITDPNRIIMMGYNKKIEKATIEMDAQFIDYDPLTGSWTFKVKHFSKYGLNDSDEEDDENQNLAAKLNIKTNNLSKTTTLVKNILDNNNENDKNHIKQEHDMIDKQLKLIQFRRMELTQQKTLIPSSLNSITNQQWDLINEYIPTNQVKTVDHSNLHLELSSDSQDDEDVVVENINFNGKLLPISSTVRKQDVLKTNNINIETDDQLDEEEERENESDEFDYNKENQINVTVSDLYPNLKKFNQKKSLKSKQNKTEKIYPNLNTLNINETYNIKYVQDLKDQQFSIEVDSNENMRFMNNQQDFDYNTIKQEELLQQQQSKKMDELPFITTMATGSYLKNGSRRLVDTFFTNLNDDEKDMDDFGMISEENVVPKLRGFNQIGSSKPIGLLKRGFGNTLADSNNIDNSSNNVLSTSQRGGQFHGQSKVSKKNVITSGLGITDIQQRIGVRLLKPRLWNRFLIQKTSKLGLKNETQQFEDLQQEEHESNLAATLKKPTTTEPYFPGYIKLNESKTYNLNWCLADSSLFNSRRFRINWSLYPTACTYTQLGSVPKNSTFLNMIQIVTPILVSNGATSFASLDQKNPNPKLKTLRDNCESFLKVQLKLTQFMTPPTSKNSLNNDKNKLPYLRPKVGNDLIRELCECTLETRNNIGDHPDADNIEHMKYVWTLCQNLWGDIPDGYKSNPNELTMTQHEMEQIRKRLLSEWLAEISSHRIEKECKLNKFNKNKENYLNSMFSYLTGNRILDACNVAIENDDFRLALLISQSSGGNDIVRTMLRKQLNEWFTCNSDRYMNLDRLKFYVLISGLLTFNLSYSKSQIVNVCENLDWKRQFALHLWYNCLPIHNINDALNAYDKSVHENICNKPVPPYIEDSIPNSTSEVINLDGDSAMKPTFKNFNDTSKLLDQQQPNRHSLYDTCYHLIKLYCDNNYQIEKIIAPLNHTSNQLDFRLSWHLAMALTALQFNNVTKACLDSLHDSYVMQLHSFGLWHWSIFVIMHIEDEKRRESYVRLYLSKNVCGESDLNEQEQFLINKLNVPAEWIYEYKAMRAKYEGQHENQFKLLLKAHKWNEAHSILIDCLAPEFFMKENFKTLYLYLSTLSKEHQFINKWNLGGQIYFDFIKLNQKAQLLFKFDELDPNSLKKNLDEDLIKEIHDQLINISNRIKEFDSRTPKKLYCLLAISKLLLKYFNIFIELNNSENGEEEEEDFNLNEEEKESKNKQKVLTKSLVDSAFEMTNSIPDHDIIGTMLLKKSKFTHDLILSSRRRVHV